MSFEKLIDISGIGTEKAIYHYRISKYRKLWTQNAHTMHMYVSLSIPYFTFIMDATSELVLKVLQMCYHYIFPTIIELILLKYVTYLML